MSAPYSQSDSPKSELIMGLFVSGLRSMGLAPTLRESCSRCVRPCGTVIKPIKKSKIKQLDLLVLTIFYFPLREETIAGPETFDFMVTWSLEIFIDQYCLSHGQEQKRWTDKGLGFRTSLRCASTDP